MVVSAVYVVWREYVPWTLRVNGGLSKKRRHLQRDMDGAARVRTLMMMIRDACVQFTCPATGQTEKQTTDNCSMWDFIYSRPTHTKQRLQQWYSTSTGGVAG